MKLCEECARHIEIYDGIRYGWNPPFAMFFCGPIRAGASFKMFRVRTRAADKGSEVVL